MSFLASDVISACAHIWYDLFTMHKTAGLNMADLFVQWFVGFPPLYSKTKETRCH